MHIDWCSTRILTVAIGLMPTLACSITVNEQAEEEDEDWVNADDGWGSGSDGEEGEGSDTDSDSTGGGSSENDENADGHLGGIDGGGEGSDGGVMDAVPACDLTGVVCYSFDGVLWPGQDVRGFCAQLSAQYEAEGAPSMTYLADGCPSGALGACSDVLMGADESGELIEGSDVTVYNYQPDEGGRFSSGCLDMGGSYEEL